MMQFNNCSQLINTKQTQSAILTQNKKHLHEIKLNDLNNYYLMIQKAIRIECKIQTEQFCPENYEPQINVPEIFPTFRRASRAGL